MQNLLSKFALNLNSKVIVWVTKTCVFPGHTQVLFLNVLMSFMLSEAEVLFSDYKVRQPYSSTMRLMILLLIRVSKVDYNQPSVSLHKTRELRTHLHR